MSSYTAVLHPLSMSSQQANLKLELGQQALDLVNTYINEPSFVMEVIGGNVTGTPKKILLVDKKQFFKELKEDEGQITANTNFTISNLVDGNKYAFEFHIKYAHMGVDIYSSAIEVEPHSFPLAPVIFDVTSGNNGMLVTLNTITRNTVADGFVDIQNVHFVLLNVEEDSTGRDIQVTSKPFVYGTGSTQSYELRNISGVTIANNNTYEVCAYYENEFGERSPLSNTDSVLVSPAPNEVRSFGAVVNDVSLCIDLSWTAPVGTYPAPVPTQLVPNPPRHSGAHTNDANVLDVDSIIDFYRITRTGPNTQVLTFNVDTKSTDGDNFTYKDSNSLAAGVDYTYSIVAHNQYGNGTATDPVNQIYYLLPTATSRVDANPITDRVSELKIEWPTPSNFLTNGCTNNDYVIQRYFDVSGVTTLDTDFNPSEDACGNLVITTTGSSNAYVDRFATVGTKYKYSINVECKNPNPQYQTFNSPQRYSNTVTALQPPDSPQNLSAVAGNTIITYSWKAPADLDWDADPNDAAANPDLKIAGYALSVKPASSSSGYSSYFIDACGNMDACGNTYTYAVPNLSNGTEYAAEITAYVTSGSNNTKVFSSARDFTNQIPYGPASVITKLECVASTSNEAQNTLTWDGSINLLTNGGQFYRYQINRTASDASASTVLTTYITDIDEREYVDSSCNQGVKYTYSFSINTQDANYPNPNVFQIGNARSVTGTPTSQPDITNITVTGNQLVVKFTQNGSKVTSLLAVGIDSSSSQNMVKQIPNIDLALGTSNQEQTYSVTLGSSPTNGGLVVIGNGLGFAYSVLQGSPPVLIDGSSANAPTASP